MHTFLFTDIADHTALWAANAQGMSIALTDYEQTLERAVIELGGMVVKSIAAPRG